MKICRNVTVSENASQNFREISNLDGSGVPGLPKNAQICYPEGVCEVSVSKVSRRFLCPGSDCATLSPGVAAASRALQAGAPRQREQLQA